MGKGDGRSGNGAGDGCGGSEFFSSQVAAMAKTMAPAASASTSSSAGKGHDAAKGGSTGCGWSAQENEMWAAMEKMMGMGAWGAPQSFGPWASGSNGWNNWGAWESAPYNNTKKEEKDKQRKKEEEQQRKWEERNRGPFPHTNWLQVADTAKEVIQGYPATMPALEYNKDMDIFSESHQILQHFFRRLVADECKFEQDWDGTMFPEVHAAWKAADNYENTVTVAKCQPMKLWAAGFGNKAKGLTAAKLALALCVANKAAPHTVERVVKEFPQFSE